MKSDYSSDGYSLIELTFVLGLMTTMSAAAVGSTLAAVESLRTVGAVRYMAARLQQTRMDAISRGANAALRFTAVNESYSFAVYADGNGDGVRSSDIQNGIDKRIHPHERIAHQFPGIDFGTLPNLPAVDDSSPAPGADPIKFGVSNMASFTPLGTATAGSVYLLGPHRAQFVVRLFGDTGKVRILRFNERTRQWESL